MEQRRTTTLCIVLDLVTRGNCLSEFLNTRLLVAKGLIQSHAKSRFWNFSDAHVAGADCVLLHNARAVTLSSGAETELRNDEY